MGLRVHQFGENNPLEQLQDTDQGQYLKCYLRDLGTTTIVEEDPYFDRDFLAEHAAFYSRAASSILNRTRRLHFFKNAITERTIDLALANQQESVDLLKTSYLGFSVLRPLHHAPFGRTVLC